VGEGRRLAEPPRRRRDRQHLALGPVNAQRHPPRAPVHRQPHARSAHLDQVAVGVANRALEHGSS
jgi:hypothetical protein